ncbi:glycosyl hydrolase family 65 protein [Propioniciclava soli]|uniref:Glycosyl hydrolase family 65 protein n=1 Tax=Propioniciclava soli TaxID=2775081 RepID=A0ABZ3C846_9ACTN
MTRHPAGPDPLDRLRFPADPWRLVEREYRSDHDHLGWSETVFAVANGYLGMRGTPVEGRDAHTHGTFVNGFHETWPIRHAENAFGFARTGQTIVNVPDSTVMKLYVDDEPLVLSTAELEQYERALDFRDGVLRRSIVWRTPAGKRVQITAERMISMTDRHLALMVLEVTLLDGDAPVVISSQVLNRQGGRTEMDPTGQGAMSDPRRSSGNGRVLHSENHWHSERRMLLGFRTKNSQMTLAVGADHTIDTDNEYEALMATEPDVGKRVYRVDAKAGQTIRVTKAVAYHTSRVAPVRELFDRCRRTLDRVRERSASSYFESQRAWFDEFWTYADIELPGQPAEQQAVRWSLFQLAQAAARTDQLGIAAKGLTGDGYEGHSFWDTDIYVVPFLAYTHPRLARNALRFRIGLLPAARRRARELNQRGALFPWRTINGEEASAYYAAGTAQYHIDADVAHALLTYARASGDVEFLHGDGVEVLVETARMWADLGFWRESDEGRWFHIHGVTGPDEYTTVVDNNLFTNVMARANLREAASVVHQLAEDDPDAHARLCGRLGLGSHEVAEWEACAERMVIPFDARQGIHPQDEHFLSRELWDVPNTPDDKLPLLLHFHPLVIYRFQVLKQADVVLALFLQGDQFSAAEKKADFDYYDPITTGDSSLSAAVQAIMAAEGGYPDLALRYFWSSLYVDLADLHANAVDGVHIAAAGGTWAALVHGFAGMRDHGGRLTFDPRLPGEWEGLRFSLRLRGQRLGVDLAPDAITFDVTGDAPVPLAVRGVAHVVEPGTPLRVALADQGPVRRAPSEVGPGVRADGSTIVANVPTVPADEPVVHA